MGASLIRSKMSLRGVTQAELAGRIGMGHNSLNRKLVGKSRFFVDEVHKICDALGLSDDDRAEILMAFKATD